MAAQARDYWKGIFPPAYDSAGGLDEGDITQFTSPASNGTPQAIKPSGAAPWLQTFYGVVQQRNTVGGSGGSAGESITVKRQGLGRLKLALNIALSRGDQLIADATTLGTVKPRTPYSHSAKVVGWAEEAQASTAAVKMFEAYVQPQDIELTRNVHAVASGAIGAATRYIAPGFVGVSAAEVPVFTAQHTGQVIRNLKAQLKTAPGGADTVVFSLVKSSDGGTTWVAIAGITCTISAAGLTAKDYVNTATLTEGDMVAIKMVSSAGTAAQPDVTFDVT